MSWLRKVTVEPAMFLQQAGDTLTYVIFQNLFIDKICKVQLDYDDAICKIYEEIDEELKPSERFMIPIMNEIQQKSSNFVLYNSLVENSLPVLLVLFLGVWSDSTRQRKPCLLLSLIGKLCRSIGLLINAYFINWDPYVLLFTAALPHSIGGANGVFHMAAFSYIADSSVPRSRTWRLGIAEACWQLGSPVGLFLGAYLYEKGGYLCVFSTAVLFHLVAVLYTSLILPEVPQPRSSHPSIGKNGTYGTISADYIVRPPRIRCFSENAKSDLEEGEEDDSCETTSLIPTIPYIHYHHHQGQRTSPASPPNRMDQASVKDFLIGSIKAIVKKRPNHTRKCLLFLGLIMLLYGIILYGEGSMKYLFTRNRFQWREQQFSLWTIFESLMVVGGLTIVLPFFSKLLRLSDPFAGAIGALGRCASRICIALAPSSEYLYYGAAFDVTGVMGPLSARSLASKCVMRDERGKVFAFLGCIEAIVPLIAVPLYSMIYTNTLTTEPSTIYFVSAALCFVIFVIFSVLFVAAKLKIVELSGTDTSALLTTTTTTQPKNPSESEGDPGTYFHNHYRRFSLS